MVYRMAVLMVEKRVAYYLDGKSVCLMADSKVWLMVVF